MTSAIRSSVPWRRWTLAILIVGSAGCTRIVWDPIIQVEAHRSAPQDLVLSNTGPTPLAVSSPDGIADPLPLPSGDRVTITMIVRSVFEADASVDAPWLVKLLGTETNLMDADNPSGYLKLIAGSGEYEMRVDRDEGPPEAFTLSLFGCPPPAWAGAPAPEAEHVIDLADLPDPGVPVRICPPS